MSSRKSNAGRKVAGDNRTEVYAAMLGELDSLIAKLPALWEYRQEMNALYQRLSEFKSRLGKGIVVSSARRCATIEAGLSMKLYDSKRWPTAAAVAKQASLTKSDNTVSKRIVEKWRTEHPKYELWRQSARLCLKLQAAHEASRPQPRSPETAWQPRPQSSKPPPSRWFPAPGDLERLLQKLLKQRHLAISSAAMEQLQDKLATVVFTDKENWHGTVTALVSGLEVIASDESPFAHFTD